MGASFPVRGAGGGVSDGGCLVCVGIGNPLFSMMSRMVFFPPPCTHFCAGGMCLVCCVETLWLHICAGPGGLRNMG